MNDTAIQGPSWDLASEYQDPACPRIEADLAEIDRRLGELAPLNEMLLANPGEPDIAAAQAIYALARDASIVLQNLSTFARCRLSVDSKDDAAQKLLGRLENYTRRYNELHQPLHRFQVLAAEEHIQAYLDHADTAPTAFLVRHARERRHELLSLREEQLITSLAQDGIHAWGALYGQLSGTLRCQVMVAGVNREMGLAEAAAVMSSRDSQARQAAWRATNTAWEGHEETCAASLNAIAGWRLELGRKRGARNGRQPDTAVHFLDDPAHMSRISRQTLTTLLGVASESRPLARRAAKLLARALGTTQLGPWDQRAPAPALSGPAARSAGGGSCTAPIPFAEALAQIAAAYGEVDDSMGDFVRMMADRRWIEGTVGTNKRPGAYCTGFARSRAPRVYLTYDGSPGEVVTLAHELGHAYHSWVMRDLPISQTSYGMSLAETASTFGETLVRDALIQRASSPAVRLEMMWEELTALVAFLLNIPARFIFEQRFYEARAERPLRPAEFKSLMSDAWTECYGDAISQPDPMFWASKLHFFISGLSFYNFPYLFGYLFSNGIYARRAGAGDDFFGQFNALLRDTGRMTAEDLARKHLGEELSEPDFWRTSIGLLESRVDAFQALLDELRIGV